MDIVLDTNVLVSSMLKPISNPATIMNAVLKTKIRLSVDERIYAEYSEILHLPKFGIPIEKVDFVLRFIAYSSRWVQCKLVIFRNESVIDPGDLPFAEVAISSCETLVTGNMKHYAFMADSGVEVLLPQQFVEKYRGIISA